MENLPKSKLLEALKTLSFYDNLGDREKRELSVFIVSVSDLEEVKQLRETFEESYELSKFLNREDEELL